MLINISTIVILKSIMFLMTIFLCKISKIMILKSFLFYIEKGGYLKTLIFIDNTN